jgi:hypothetical protein
MHHIDAEAGATVPISKKVAIMLKDLQNGGDRNLYYL